MYTSGHFINGKEIQSYSKETFEIRDPGNGALLGYAARGTELEAGTAVENARQVLASETWQRTDGAQRGRLLFAWARLFARDADRLAQILALENGKPLGLAHHEIHTAIRYCEYYGGWADKIGGREIPVDPDHFAYTRREPVGVVVQIVPWNYPLDILLRGVAPALAAGNAVIAKPAEDTPTIAVEAAKLAVEAGFPEGIFNVVLGYGHEAGAALTSHPGIHGIAFCGSAATGGKVISSAAANLVPVLSLELGGKCPTLVLPDGDVEKAALAVAGGLIYNAGQSCVARSRLIVPEHSLPRIREFVHGVLAQVHMGHSLDDPQMGPVINKKQQEKILYYLKKGQEEGATLEFGGEVPRDSKLKDGHFVSPAVFTNVDRRMTIAQEEVFGPVLSVLTYKTEEEAISIANDTTFGLAAELWSSDPAHAHGTVKKMNASHITINSSGGFGIEVPFGGIGHSGFGREGGIEGLLQYTRVKSVYMATH